MNEETWMVAEVGDEIWSYSQEYPTKEAAIKAGTEAVKALKAGDMQPCEDVFGKGVDPDMDTFNVGQTFLYKNDYEGLAENLLENAWEYCADEVGECGEDYLSFVPKEQKAELAEVIRQWFIKSGAERFDGSDDMVNKYNVRKDTEYLISIEPDEYDVAPYQISIKEGWANLEVGDYIATGIEGEHWPIRKDVFERTYEELPGETEAQAYCKYCHIQDDGVGKKLGCFNGGYMYLDFTENDGTHLAYASQHLDIYEDLSREPIISCPKCGRNLEVDHAKH